MLARYHFTVSWNYNGTKVTSRPTRGHYLRTASVALGFYDRGFTNNTATSLEPGPYAYSINLQSSLEQCVAKYGCIIHYTPWSK